MKALRWTGWLACVWLLAGVAHAEPSSADKETARSLLLDGRARMEAKDYAAALKAFKGADAIMHVPTTGIAVARAHAALGQLIEARETALVVSRTNAAKGESPAFADARAEAADLATKLAPRIPSVTVIVRGVDPSLVEVRLDGAVLPAATLGLPRKMNPGHHAVSLTAPAYAAVTSEFELKEQDAIKVELSPKPTFAPAPPVATGVATSVATGVATVSPPVSAPTATSTTGAGPVVGAPSAPVPAWAWAAGGVGIVALGAGAGFLVDFLGVRDTLARDCPGNLCDPARQDAASAQSLRGQWNRDVGLAIGLGALGVAGLGVAIAGIVARPAPSPAHPQTGVLVRRAALRVTGAGLALEGAF